VTTNVRELVAEALERAEKWFRDYERQHRAKGTSEGNLKADTNEERADYLRAAITACRQEKETTNVELPVQPTRPQPSMEGLVELVVKTILSHRPDASFDDSAAGACERAALLSNVADEVRQALASHQPPSREGGES